MDPSACPPRVLCLLLLEVLCMLRALAGGARHAHSTLHLLVSLHMQQPALQYTLYRRQKCRALSNSRPQHQCHRCSAWCLRLLSQRVPTVLSAALPFAAAGACLG